MTASSGRSILVVDDDEGHVELLRRCLKQARIQNPVVPVSSGRAALDYLLEREHPLLLLLDINLPGGLDGFEVLRRIKADPSRNGIPVAMVTTSDDPRVADRCFRLGCDVYLTKPVAPSSLLEAASRLGLPLSLGGSAKGGDG